MTREEQRAKAAHEYIQSDSVAAGNEILDFGDFIEGAKWADSHPRWYDAQGKVFYGHRPDPKEVTMIEGKPYHAKTYDKNGWNWPNIALWLDVEIPDEQVDKIATEYFKENGQTKNSKLPRV